MPNIRQSGGQLASAGTGFLLSGFCGERKLERARGGRGGGERGERGAEGGVRRGEVIFCFLATPLFALAPQPSSRMDCSMKPAFLYHLAFVV
jgi:hypothetical protein